MPDDQSQQPPSFPTYQPPPTGVPVAHPSQSKVLMKMVRSLAIPKIKAKASPGKVGFKRGDGVKIGHGKKVIWY